MAAWLLAPEIAAAATFTTDFSSQPAGVTLYGDPGDGSTGAVVEDGVLKLTKLVGGVTASMIIDDFDNGATITGFTATFKLLIGGGTGADGFSFNFGGDLPDGGISEEGAGTGLTVCFDTYDNGNAEAPAIDLKIGGQVVSHTPISPRSALAANTFLLVRINLDVDGTVDVSYGDMVILQNFYTQFTPTPGRFGLGARTGGSYDNHWVDDLTITTKHDPQVPPAHPLVVTNLPAASGNSPEATISITIQDFTTKVKSNTVTLKVNGVAVTPTVSQDSGLTYVTYDPPGLFGSGSANTYELSYTDDGTPAYVTTLLFTFNVATYSSIVLPTPIYLETFDTTDEGSVPTGWTQTNATTVLTGSLDLSDPNSDSYLGWTVVDRSRMDGAPFNSRRLNVAPGYLNGVLITNLIDGRFVYAESDNRSGNQIQMLFSPDFDLTGKTNVCVSYHSIYEQNQDSLGALEYSIDQGKTWLPVIIMLDVPDILTVTNNKIVVIDSVSTLTNIQTDSPQVDDGTGTGTTRRTAYGEFLANQNFAAMGPYLSGRINDDPTESKRVELFRLYAADNQSKVRFRFVQAGTGSWYFGVDDFGLYSMPGQTFAPPTLSVKASGGKATISWPAAVTGYALITTSGLLTNTTWQAVSGVTDNTVTVEMAGPQFFRLIRK